MKKKQLFQLATQSHKCFSLSQSSSITQQKRFLYTSCFITLRIKKICTPEMRVNKTNYFVVSLRTYISEIGPFLKLWVCNSEEHL